MKIKLHEIKISKLIEGYKNDGENGVVGYGGQLDIRPKYQREFVYEDLGKEIAVIETIMKGYPNKDNYYPLNVMYWSKDKRQYEMLDGQQRTLSICRFFDNKYEVEINGAIKKFNRFTEEEKDYFLNYPLSVYFCTDGSTTEKLEWFKTINTAGKALNDQELTNALYTGEWLTSAKSYFSKKNGAVNNSANIKRLLKGECFLQDYLHTALCWVNKGDYKGYMAKHQEDKNADELWNEFKKITDWVNGLFTKTRGIMKSVNWGELYDKYHKDWVVEYDGNDYSENWKKKQEEIENEINSLLSNEEIDHKSGVYEFFLSGEKNLKLVTKRVFSKEDKISAYEKQKGICPICGEHFEFEEMEGDHIKPWSKGNPTTFDNLQMLCKSCNNKKSDK